MSDCASIHGICYDEGQAGHCGPECIGFLDRECTIPHEIVEIFKEELLTERFGILRLAVLRKQSILPFDEQAILKEIARDYGYEQT